MDFRVRKPADGSNPGATEEAGPEPGLCGTAVPRTAVASQLERILNSSHFRYSERLSRFLKYAVERTLAGTPEQLKESVLAIEIFDRNGSYDSRVDSVVRVEARRLREKLDKYYAAEGAADPVLIELPKGSYVPAIKPRFAPVESRTSQLRPPAQFRIGTVLAFVGAAILVAVLVTRWAGGGRTVSSAPVERLTSDPGLTFQPAISPDGRLLAYASDRGGAGALDIWVQQIPHGAPLRITDNPADEFEPAFSPDGTALAFRQEGEQGGIYTVPALGGKSVLLAPGGYRPRFSPDGTRIAYWTGERSFRVAKIFTIGAKGGEPVQVQHEFAYAAYPVWSPDGRYLLFVGAREMLGDEPNVDNWDWWVTPVQGGTPVKTSARERFRSQGLRTPEARWAHRWILPYAWTARGDILFSARSGDQTNVWKIPISNRDWRIRGPAVQLTFGAGRQDQPGIADDGSLVFTALNHKSDLWSIPLEKGTDRVAGAPVRLTSGPSGSNRPSVSRDGQRLAFVSDRTGSDQVWVKDLATGREAALTATPEEKDAAVISPDGNLVAFGYAKPLPQAIMVVPFGGGKVATLCRDCGLPRTWIPGSQAVVFQRLSPPDSIIGMVDESARPRTLVQVSGASLFSPSVSPDGAWLAVILRNPPNDHRVMLVPLRALAPAPRDQWITATEPGAWVDKPRWSGDGRVLYYVTDRDGFVCLWSQRFDPARGRLEGYPVAVAHFHNARISMSAVFGFDLSAGGDKLVFNLGDTSGNIWRASAP